MRPSRFLIGVDSDGTAFDSMNRKHLDAFIPAALETWPMDAGTAARFTAIEKEVNLYSSLRGINRFPGLLETLERLEKACPDAPGMPDLTDLRAYIAGESRYSPMTLKAWMAAHPSAELEKVLRWSDRGDEKFSRACEGLMPFPNVREALFAAWPFVTVAVVSSAGKAGLEKDWAAGGLMPYVDLLMSQEDGSKAAQLKKAMAQCEAPVAALMLGDTEGDGASAREAGARFYPILPGEEEACWLHFGRQILPQFLAGEYGEAQERTHLSRLKALLGR